MNAHLNFIPKINSQDLRNLDILTPRLQKLIREWKEAPPLVSSESTHLFTESWKKTEGQPLDLRMAKAYANIMNNSKISIREGELIVGSQTRYVKGVDVITAFMPVVFLQQLKERQLYRQMSDSTHAEINEEEEKILMEDTQYWVDHLLPDYESIALREELGEDHFDLLDDTGRIIEGPVPKAHPMRTALAGPAGTPEPHIHVINTGLNAIIAKARKGLDTINKSGSRLGTINGNGYRKVLLLKSIIISCEAIIEWAQRYSALAEDMAKEEKDTARRRELEKIAEICSWVPANPPRNYWEALQALRFLHLAIRKETPHRVQITVGRLDQLLNPYYEKDIAENKITRQQAAELLGCFWLKTREGESISLQEKGREGGVTPGSLLTHVTIGGRDSKGADVTNDTSWIILEVMRQMRLSEPSVYIRYHDGMDDDFMLFALECNRDFQGGNPSFINDQMGTNRNLSRGVKLEDAVDWYASGCLGYNLDCVERTMGAHNLNQAKILELTLNNGFDPRTNKQLGPKTGDVTQFKSIEDFYDAFFRQMDYFADQMRKDCFIRRSVNLANGTMIRSGVAATMLFEDSIKTGLAQNEGGARYPVFQQWWVGDRGITDVADCLAAIKSLVFDNKKVSIEDLMDALNRNWEGKEEIRHMCLNAPKYGNDDDYIDDIFNYVSLKAQEIMQSRPDPFTGLKPFLYKGAAAGHVIHGEVVGALPNGRLAGTPVNDGGTSAMPGMDLNGPTALINSATKVNHAWEEAGMVHNMKFPVTMMNNLDKIKNVLLLVKEFFRKGGWHIQFNIHNVEDLLDAKKNPENWRHLVVRVAGFSAYFVDLPPSLQDEIIGRTLHTV